METKDIKSEILKKLEGLKEKILSFFFKRNTKKITSLNDKNELIAEAIKESQKKFENQVKEEKENFAREKERIINEKKAQIKQIEIDKKKEINENNKKFKDLISYLDSIKYDKQKIIEYFQNNNFN